MSSAHLMEPDLRDFFLNMPPMELSRDTIVQVRAEREQMALAMMPPLPPEVSIFQEYAPGRDGARLAHTQ